MTVWTSKLQCLECGAKLHGRHRDNCSVAQGLVILRDCLLPAEGTTQ